MNKPSPEGTASPAVSAEVPYSLFEQRASLACTDTERARMALEAAEFSQTFWTGLVGHLAKNELASALLHLDRHSDFRRSMEISEDPMFEQLELLRAAAEATVRSTTNELGRSFPEAARSAGLVIDSSSRHPRYTFQNGFVRMELDEKRLVAKLQSREGESEEYGLDLTLVIQVLRAEISRLFEREFKPEPFLRSLLRAYAAVLRSEKIDEGTEVPIRRVTNRLGKNLSHFSTDEFSIDLARAVQSGHTSIDGHQLHLNHTRNTRQGMLLHGLEQGGYVGFISFKREERR